jgi:hypothetical protein
MEAFFLEYRVKDAIFLAPKSYWLNVDQQYLLIMSIVRFILIKTSIKKFYGTNSAQNVITMRKKLLFKLIV